MALSTRIILAAVTFYGILHRSVLSSDPHGLTSIPPKFDERSTLKVVGRKIPSFNRPSRLRALGSLIGLAVPPNSLEDTTTATIITSEANATTTDVTPTDAQKSVGRIIDVETSSLIEKYSGRLVCCTVPAFPHCDILLCGTLHVAKTSADMVQDVVNVLKPQYVVLELCEARIDNLVEMDEEIANITLSQVLQEAFKERSFKMLGMGLLTWMQMRAAKVVGNKLGGELTIAAKEGARNGATVILGDRLYGVTIQRVFDKLKLFEKLKLVLILIWEVLTMSFFKLKDYIKKSEDQKGFIEDEIARFGKHLPSFAKVLIEERDEYLAQTLYEIARVVGATPVANHPNPLLGNKRIRVLAVVGAGHLAGIQRTLAAGGVSDERIKEISTSSKHPAGTWLGKGMLHVVSPEILLPRPPQYIQMTEQPQQQQQQQHPVQHNGERQQSINTHEHEPPIAATGSASAEQDRMQQPAGSEDGTVVPTFGVFGHYQEHLRRQEEAIIEKVKADAEEELAAEPLSQSTVAQANLVVRLLSALTESVQRVNAVVADANRAAHKANTNLPPQIQGLLSALGDAVKRSKAAFVEADEAEKKASAADAPAHANDDLSKALTGLSTAVKDATEVAESVVKATNVFLESLK